MDSFGIELAHKILNIRYVVKSAILPKYKALKAVIVVKKTYILIICRIVLCFKVCISPSINIEDTKRQKQSSKITEVY